MAAIRRLKHYRARRDFLPLAIDERLQRALLEDEELFVRVLMRRMRRETCL